MSEGGTMRIEQKKLLVITTLKNPIVGSITGNSRLFSHRLLRSRKVVHRMLGRARSLTLPNISLSHFFCSVDLPTLSCSIFKALFVAPI